MNPQQIHIENKQDRWRFVCPHGHRSWEPTNNHFWCHACARDPAASGEFSELHDKRDDVTLERDEIELVTPAGPYRHDGTA